MICKMRYAGWWAPPTPAREAGNTTPKIKMAFYVVKTPTFSSANVDAYLHAFWNKISEIACPRIRLRGARMRPSDPATIMTQTPKGGNHFCEEYVGRHSVPKCGHFCRKIMGNACGSKQAAPRIWYWMFPPQLSTEIALTSHPKCLPKKLFTPDYVVHFN